MKLSSKGVALMGVFSSLHAVLYITSFELWRSWAIFLEPLEGIILGPYVGFASALIGSIAGRAIRPSGVWMFGVIAEPVAVLSCGFVAKREWRPVLTIYTAMLGAYFIHPLGRQFPLWTIIDILVAFVLIYPVTRMYKNIFEEDPKVLPFLVPLIAFICTVTDSLTRVFLFIPAGFSTALGWPLDVVYWAFIGGAIDSYIEDILVILVSSFVSAPLLAVLRKIPGIKYPLS